MDRAKILDKIKKCMALGKSANEHEAAAAMRQAQKLMERHGVTETELGAVGYGQETVDTSTQVGRGRRKKDGTYERPKVPMTFAWVIDLISHAFGVRPVVSATRREKDLNWSVTYYGPEHRVTLAAYAHVVVSRACEAAWQKHLKENPHLKGQPGGRAGFYAGWVQAVRATVEEFAMTPEEVAGTELVINQSNKTLLKSNVNKQKVYNSAVNGGAKGAEGFSLHRPVNAERKRLT